MLILTFSPSGWNIDISPLEKSKSTHGVGTGVGEGVASVEGVETTFPPATAVRILTLLPGLLAVTFTFFVTVTLTVAIFFAFFVFLTTSLTVTFVFPSFTPVTTPLLLTFAIFLLEVFQVTDFTPFTVSETVSVS